MTGPVAVGARFVWPDVARGACMILVVLWHAALWFQNEIAAGQLTPWIVFGNWMTPVRMPLFFFISGYFSARALTKPLSASRRRTWGMLYLYVIWTFIFVCRLYLPQARSGEPAPAPWDVVLALLLPTSFWYLWALAAYFFVAWAIIRVLGKRAWWLLPAFAVVAVAAPVVQPYTVHILDSPLDAVKASSVLANLVWFLAGVFLRPAWDAAMRGATVTRLGAIIGLFVLGWALQPFWSALPASQVIVLTLSCLAVSGSAIALALLPNRARVSRLCARIGRDTLPIYIFQMFLISMISAVVKFSGLVSLMELSSTALAWVVPPAIVAVVIPLSLACARLVRRSPMRWLLIPPQWLVGTRDAAVRQARQKVSRDSQGTSI